MKRDLIFVLGSLLILLSACGVPSTEKPVSQPTQAEPVVQPSDTPVPVPTDTPIPTSTPVPTPLPEGTLFRDDFTGSLLPGWTWENEDPTRWSITSDGWLQILANDPSLLAGQPQINTLWRDLPDGPFTVSVHVISKTTTNFQQTAIFLYEDINNYVAINRGYCAPCFPGEDGNGIFMDYKINGQGGAYKFHVTQDDVYLRLVFDGDVISAYYALTPDAWERLGRFGNYFKFTRVGLGAANIDQEGENEDLVAQYDYFEITKP
jgi:hypothetical protein